MSSSSGLTQGGERNLGPALDAVAVVTLVLAMLFVVLRLLVRVYLEAGMG